MSVLIDSGRIVAVGPDGSVSAPDGANVIEAAGKYLTPGFVDSHVHLFQTWGNNWPDTVAELGWILAHGVTTIREAGGGGGRARLQESYIRLREAADSALIDSPRIVVSGTGRDLLRLTGASTLADAFAGFRKSGLNQLKLGSMPREQALEQIRLAHEAGVTVYGHHSHWPNDHEREEFAMAAVAAGINGLTHGGGLPDGTRRYPLSQGVRWNSPPEQRSRASLAEYVDVNLRVDSAAQQAWIEQVVNQGTWLEPTLPVSLAAGPLRYGRCTDPVDIAAIRRYYPFYAETAALPLTEAQADTVRLGCESRFRFLRAFHEAGGVMVAGTDEVPFPPLGVQWSMSLLVRAGLSPLVALQAATINSARALDLGDRIGTIEVGRDADLVLLDGDPLEDIHNVRRVSAVIARGRLIDRQALLAREGTSPPMMCRRRSTNTCARAGKGLDAMSSGAAAVAREQPDTIVRMSVVVNELYRAGDFRGVQRWMPAVLQEELADTLVVQAPAYVIDFLSQVRFVQNIFLR